MKVLFLKEDDLDFIRKLLSNKETSMYLERNKLYDNIKKYEKYSDEWCAIQYQIDKFDVEYYRCKSLFDYTK